MAEKHGHSSKAAGFKQFVLLLARRAVFPVCLAVLSLGGCAGGSLFNPRPLIGKDRLVYKVTDPAEGVSYYTRNIWFDGDNFRFHDVYGRDKLLLKSDSLQIELISIYDYYDSPI